MLKNALIIYRPNIHIFQRKTQHSKALHSSLPPIDSCSRFSYTRADVNIQAFWQRPTAELCNGFDIQN